MREMKDSGIEWVGDIPFNWKSIQNKYVMRKVKNLVPVYKGEPILSLTMNGVIERDFSLGGKMPSSFNGYQKVCKGNLLMCLFDIDVTPRCIGLVKQDGLCSPAYSHFVLNDEAHADYFYYYYLMVDNTKELLHMAKNLRHSLTEDQLGDIKVPFPPYEEQQKIATFLDKKCTEIDSLTKDIETQIENLQQYKKSVITEAVTKGLDPNVEMKDSGVDWCDSIPKTWDVRKIKSLVSAMTDGTHASFQRVDNGQYLLSAKNVFEDGLHISDNESMISDYDYKAITANGFPKKNDILMCCVGTIGRCTKYEYDYPIAFQRSVIFLRTNEEILPDMLKYCLMSSYTLQQETLNVNQTAQAGLYQGSVGNLKITIPSSIKEQKEIIKFLDQKCSDIDSIIESKQQQLTTLADYKKSLIFEYVTGKKEV